MWDRPSSDRSHPARGWPHPVATSIPVLWRSMVEMHASTSPTRTVIHMHGAPLAREPSDTVVKSKATTLGG